MTYQVLLRDMPSSIKAFTVKNWDDSYTVVINAKLDRRQQQECFLHEFHHMSENHFDCFQTVDEIERRCNSEESQQLWDGLPHERQQA